VPTGIGFDAEIDVEEDIRRLDIQEEDIDLDAIDMEFPPFRDSENGESVFSDSGDDADGDDSDGDADADDLDADDLDADDLDADADADADGGMGSDADADADSGTGSDADADIGVVIDADSGTLSDADSGDGPDAADADADATGSDGGADANTGDTLVVDADSSDTDAGTFEPGTPWVAYVQDQRLRFIRADGTGDIAWDGALNERVFAMDWSPDGTMLAINGLDSSGDAQVQVIDFVDRDVTTLSLRLAGNPVVPTSGIAWSPDGETLAFTYRPPGEGNAFGIYTVNAGAALAGTATLAAVPGALAGDSSPVWGQGSGDLYFLRHAAASSTIVAVDYPSTVVRTVVNSLNFLGLFTIDGVEDLMLAQVQGVTAYGELRQVEIGVRNSLFGQPGDSAPAFFGGADPRAVFVRDFGVGGSPQMDMVLYEPGEAALVRLTTTNAAIGPAFMSVSPVGNSELVLGPFPF
jgi:hypothetical protein